MKAFYELISVLKDSKCRYMCASMYTLTKKVSHAYTCIHIHLRFASFKILFLQGFHKQMDSFKISYLGHISYEQMNKHTACRY